jgi:hypothetical protein
VTSIRAKYRATQGREGAGSLTGTAFFVTTQVVDIACAKLGVWAAYWVQAMGMARRSKAFSWIGFGRVRMLKRCRQWFRAQDPCAANSHASRPRIPI